MGREVGMGRGNEYHNARLVINGLPGDFYRSKMLPSKEDLGRVQ